MTSNPEASTPDSALTPTELSTPSEALAPTELSAPTEPSTPTEPSSPAEVSPPAEASAGAETPVAPPSGEGTFSTILEPKSENRLPLGDGTWHQLARQYVWVQLISAGIGFAIVAGAALAVWLIFGFWFVWIPAGVILVIIAITMSVTPRQARAYGYQLRDDDLVFRKGILWQRVVAVPYGRMQLVDITHGPLDRGFGIAQLKLVTAAATTGVVIPGIPQASAETLRDTLIAVAETRRTGL